MLSVREVLLTWGGFACRLVTAGKISPLLRTRGDSEIAANIFHTVYSVAGLIPCRLRRYGLLPADTPLLAAGWFIVLLTLISGDKMIPPLVKPKYPSLVGHSFLRDEKSSSRVLKKDFCEWMFEGARRRIYKKDRERHGDKYKPGQMRPAEGAFVIVPEEDVAVMLDVLIKNGLVWFENNMPIDFFAKKVKMREGEYIDEVPVSCEIYFLHPEQEGDSAQIIFRVHLIDPCFVDEDERPLFEELPPKYIKAVLNNMNPLAIYLAYAKRLPEMLERTIDQADGLDRLIKHVAKKWKEKQAPSDFETMKAFVTLGLLHEFAHALVLHLPDHIPSDISSELKSDLETITFDRYLEIVNNDGQLLTSAVFIKNLLKALNEAKEKEPSKKTSSTIFASLAVEMFCDRFAMFLYENYLKLQIYEEFFTEADMMLSVDIGLLLRLERQRKAGELCNMRGLKSALSFIDLDELESKLTAAEQSHVYISKYGDPPLSSAEIDFFAKSLLLMIDFDREKKLLNFSMEHAVNSRFMRVSVGGLEREA